MSRSPRARESALQWRYQLVQLSVVGLVAGVAAPPVAVTPVRDGIEKKVFTHAAGVAAVMLASLVIVAASCRCYWAFAELHEPTTLESALERTILHR